MKKKGSFFRNMLRKRGATGSIEDASAIYQSERVEETNVPLPTRGQEQRNFRAQDYELHPPPGKFQKFNNRDFFSKKPTGPKPMPVIVVTDIGADIDDTLALFVLLGSMDAVKILAIVTSVNNGLHRGAVTRGFLRLFGISDESIEILPSVDGCVADCYIPESFPSAKEAAMGELGATPRRIVELCRDHMDTGVLLFGIASLSPIAEAIKIDKAENGYMKQALKAVYLQGNCYVSNGERKTSNTRDFLGEEVRIMPNPLAYNFKNDMSGANEVFDYFQDDIPFTILGKFAAYKVPVRKGDFNVWTRRINQAWTQTNKRASQKLKIPNPIDLLEVAKRQMKRFRDQNPNKFDSIYNVPKNLDQYELEKFDWFDDLPNEFVCSHPYDPLLGLRMVDDIRLNQKQGRTTYGNGGFVPKRDHTSERLFQEYRALSQNGHHHVIIGNIPSQHSIPDAESVHDILVAHISKGLAYHGDSPYIN